MSQSQVRLFAAMGFLVVGKLSFRCLKAFQAQDPGGSRRLLVQGKVLGPGWPSIALHLESHGTSPKLLEIAGVWLEIEDTDSNRQVLNSFALAYKQSRAQEVLIPGQGFATSGLPKRFDYRVLLAPALVLVVTLALVFVPKPGGTEVELEPVQEIRCALDLESDELNFWVSSQLLLNKGQEAKQFVMQTELGLLDIKTESLIGSTGFFSGYLQCSDGRSKQLAFRADSEAPETLVWLKQEKD